MLDFFNGSAILQAAAEIFNEKGINSVVGDDDIYDRASSRNRDSENQSNQLPHSIRLRLLSESTSDDRTTIVKRALFPLAEESIARKSLPSVVREFFAGNGGDVNVTMGEYIVVASSSTTAPTTTAIVDLFKNLHFINATTSGAALKAHDASIATANQPALPLGIWLSVLVGALLFTLFFFCVVGNMFVIMAVILERDLRSRPQYYLIFSLAMADLLVGIIVIPLGAWTTLNQAWHLGVTLCDFWISVDVLVCTSSILHLVAIALDRYWSISDIYYVQNRTPKRIFFMLLLIWVVSLLISLAPIFGWKDAQFVDRVQEQHVCLISQQISYQVFSTATAFYIPLCAIIIVYYKIMRAAKKRFRRERDRRTLSKSFCGSNRPTADDATVALTSTSFPIEGNGMVNGGCGRSKPKAVIKKKSAPSSLSSHEISPFDGSPTVARGDRIPKPQYEATTVMLPSEEEKSKKDSVSRFMTCAALSKLSSTTPANCCCKTSHDAHFSADNYQNNNKNDNTVDCIAHYSVDDNSKKSSNATINHLAANHLYYKNKRKNIFCKSPALSVTMASKSQSQLENQYIKKLNVRSFFVKRSLGGINGGGARATLIRGKKGMRVFKESTESRRERKAWRTLAIITGTFVACWTPFFLVSLYRPICACHIPPVVENVTQWLGYLNSALNPIIYTVFSMDFRMAFQRILKRMCFNKGF